MLLSTDHKLMRLWRWSLHTTTKKKTKAYSSTAVLCTRLWSTGNGEPIAYFQRIFLHIHANFGVKWYKNHISNNLKTASWAEEPVVARKVGRGLPLFTALFAYRVSCPDQQGQTDPLITETADENESKMRPITKRAWLISFYRSLHTHWTHARLSYAHTTSYTCTHKKKVRRAH